MALIYIKLCVICECSTQGTRRSLYFYRTAVQHRHQLNECKKEWMKWISEWINKNNCVNHGRDNVPTAPACNELLCYFRRSVNSTFLASDAFVRANRHAIAMMFVRLSVCLSGTGVHGDHTVHFIAVLLSLWLDSPMFWAPWHQSMSTYTPSCFFQFHPEVRWGASVQTRRDISRTVEDRG